MSSSVSVLMAEAAAMSLAAVITDRLQLQHTNFLSDNQDLAQFFNSADYSYTPDMRIKHLTQTFVNHTQHRSTGTFKINRSQPNCSYSCKVGVSRLPIHVHTSYCCLYLLQLSSCTSMPLSGATAECNH